MNKTVTINLGGMVFHIDENAYEFLKKYLDSIRKHFGSSRGSEEIIADLESRIGEMFRERTGDHKQAVQLQDVEEVTAAMGKPEEFGPGEKTDEQKQHEADSTTGKKRLYRDPDHKVLGGVCSGIAAYFDVDPMWIRLAFILALFGITSGFWIYIILWAIIPKAMTTAEKLEMRGEKINVSTIERSIKEEIDSLKESLNGLKEDAKGFTKGDKFRKVYSPVTKLGGVVTDVVGFAIKFILKTVAIGMVLLGLAIFIALTLFIFQATGIIEGQLFFSPFHFPDFIIASVQPGFQFALAIIALVLITNIPVILVIYSGLRLLFNIRKNNVFRNILIGMWVVGIILGVALISRGLFDFANHSAYTENIPIAPYRCDTLYLDASPAVETTYDHGRRNEYRFAMETTGAETRIYHQVSLTITKSESGEFELIKTQRSRGRSRREATRFAKSYKYIIWQHDSLIRFDDIITLGKDEKFHGQKVELTLKVPVGKTIHISNDLDEMLSDHDPMSGFADIDLAGHTLQMQEAGLKCTDCGQISGKSSLKSISGNYTQFPELKNFNSIEATGAYSIHILHGDEFNVNVKGKKQDIEHTRLEVHGHTLTVETEFGVTTLFRKMDGVDIYVTLPELEELELSGASVSDIHGFKGRKINIHIAGAGNLDLSSDFEAVNVEAEGASKITLAGHGERMEVSLSGASMIEAREMQVDIVKISMAGACHGSVFATGHLESKLSGASSLSYRGNPIVGNSSSGLSSIEKEE